MFVYIDDDLDLKQKHKKYKTFWNKQTYKGHYV